MIDSNAEITVNKKQRNSSIELLRILAMVMIVFHHFAVHGGFSYDVSDCSLPRMWYGLITMGGKIGSNIFVLISGYYLVTNTEKMFDVKRVAKFWAQVLFYSVLLWLVLGICGFTDIGIKPAVEAVFPISFSTWWFASEYFVLLLISPFLNMIINQLPKKTYQGVLAVLLILFSVIPTITTCYYQFGNTMWFITLYFAAGYIRLYGKENSRKPIFYGMMALALFVLTYASQVVFTVLGVRYSVFAEHAFYFYGQEKINIFFFSYFLFRTFETMKERNWKLINSISAATFGVYLIHDYPAMREVLWKNIFKNAEYQDSVSLIGYSIICVAITFLACVLIDTVRRVTLEKTFLKILNKRIK